MRTLECKQGRKLHGMRQMSAKLQHNTQAFGLLRHPFKQYQTQRGTTLTRVICAVRGSLGTFVH